MEKIAPSLAGPAASLFYSSVGLVFPAACGIRRAERTFPPGPCAVALHVSSTEDALCARNLAVATREQSAYLESARVHDRRGHLNTLGRYTHAPASLTRRRAFSSGLSHAKCPRPGSRANVFGW